MGTELCKALCKAQAEMQDAKHNSKNPHFGSDYADLTAVLNAVRGPFSKNGLAITQPIITRDGITYVRTVLMHESGETLESEMPLNLNAKPQAVGSCITYWRRYQLMAICGLSSCQDDAQAPADSGDDDGNGAQAGMSSAQPSRSIEIAPASMIELIESGLAGFPTYKANVEARLTHEGFTLKRMPVQYAQRIINQIELLHKQATAEGASE